MASGSVSTMSKYFLMPLGFNARVAYNGEEALEKVKQPTDVIVLDLRMPGMDGFEVLKAVKKSNPDVQVIILTGHGGDAEPCAFIHYSDTNLKEHSLIEALQAPLFSEYAKSQPFSPNYLRPCPLLDNKGALAKMVHDSDADSTDLSAKEDVDDLCAKCADAADNWKPVADSIWQKTHPGAPL